MLPSAVVGRATETAGGKVQLLVIAYCKTRTASVKVGVQVQTKRG